jgi:hypothetical protein
MEMCILGQVVDTMSFGRDNANSYSPVKKKLALVLLPAATTTELDHLDHLESAIHVLES